MDPCATCRNLEPLPGLSTGGFITGGTGSDLQSSAATCKLCSILLEGLRAFCFDSPGRYSWMAFRKNEGEDLFLLEYKLRESAANENWTGLHFYTKDSRNPFSGIFKPSHDLEPDTASEKYISQMKDWVDACDSKHDICRNNLRTSHLPTRVLDVSRDPFKVFLKEPEENDDGPYVALSHCWGGLVPIMATKETLEKFRKGVSIESFPKTFRDAIFVTRQLQCRYLWIDSICIIQDSPEDWRKEASGMADVYGNAYITILATASSDSHGGLFCQHDPLDARHTIKRAATDGGALTVEVRPFLEHTPYFASSPYGLGPRVKAPLLDRSWCFQEYLLAPRVLSFTQWEVLWLCLSERSCNCGEYSENTREIVASSDLKARFDKQIRGASPPDRLHGTWQDVVEAYLRKGLTYDTDRLPALAGIARLFKERGLGRYVNGLWEPTLLSDLFWSIDWRYAQSYGIITKRSTDQEIPSWSWASVSGSFQYPPNPHVFKGIEILGISYEPVIADPFAEICAKSITIRGMLVQARAWGGKKGQVSYQRWIEAQEIQKHDWHIDVMSELCCDADGPSEVYIFCGTTAPALILRRLQRTASTYRRLGVLETFFSPNSEAFCAQTIQLV